MDHTPTGTPDTHPPPAGALLPVLGAVLAGGASRRFGSPKALASVGGARLVTRVAAALSAVVTHPVIITDLAEVRAAAGLPARGDSTAGAGPLAGVEAALAWAEEMALPGALCVACDLPFVAPALLRELATRGVETGAPAVVPESAAPGEIEPLCAWYAVGALHAVRRSLGLADRSLVRLLAELGAERLPRARVARHGDPAVLFLNVNTPSGHRAAEAIDADLHG